MSDKVCRHIVPDAIFLMSLVACLLTGCKKKLVVDSEIINYKEVVNPPSLDVFIENSGSMDGYMCDGSELKDAVYSYVSELNRNADTTRLFFINSEVIPYKKRLAGFVKDLTPQSFRAAGGNRSNSDMGEMLKHVLEHVSESTVSVFISDCILDLPQDAMNFLNIKKIYISNCISEKRKNLPNLSIKILKMQSKFNGMYYYSKGHGNPVKINNENRPYYIWILGTYNNLSFLDSKVPTSEIKYGFMNEVSFTPYVSVPFEVSGKGQGKVINAAHGQYEMLIKADFRPTLRSHTEISDVSNYQAYSSDVKIEEICKIKAESKYSHYMRQTVIEENIRFKTTEIPQWVINSNDISGRDIEKNMKKTTGILSLIEGVAEAYKENTVNTNFKFSLKRK